MKTHGKYTFVKKVLRDFATCKHSKPSKGANENNNCNIIKTTQNRTMLVVNFKLNSRDIKRQMNFTYKTTLGYDKEATALERSLVNVIRREFKPVYWQA